MLPQFMKQTITRLRPLYIVERGSSIPDFTDCSKTEISGCSIQPAETSLSEDGRVLGITDGLTVYAPFDSDVKAGDMIEVDGEVYEIFGLPRKWTSPTGALSNMQINLKRYSG